MAVCAPRAELSSYDGDPRTLKAQVFAIRSNQSRDLSLIIDELKLYACTVSSVKENVSLKFTE